MREEIKSSIDEAFASLNSSNDNIQNKGEEDKYRKELLDKINSLKELGFIIDYNDNMTNEQLEDIINSVNY